MKMCRTWEEGWNEWKEGNRTRYRRREASRFLPCVILSVLFLRLWILHAPSSFAFKFMPDFLTVCFCLSCLKVCLVPFPVWRIDRMRLGCKCSVWFFLIITTWKSKGMNLSWEERNQRWKVFLSLSLCKPCLSVGKRVSQLIIIISFKCWWRVVHLHHFRVHHHVFSSHNFLLGVFGGGFWDTTCTERHANVHTWVCVTVMPTYTKNIIKSKSLAAAAVCPAGLGITTDTTRRDEVRERTKIILMKEKMEWGRWLQTLPQQNLVRVSISSVFTLISSRGRVMSSLFSPLVFCCVRCWWCVSANIWQSRVKADKEERGTKRKMEKTCSILLSLFPFTPYTSHRWVTVINWVLWIWQWIVSFLSLSFIIVSTWYFSFHSSSITFRVSLRRSILFPASRGCEKEEK